jgi:hypothetical protein
MALIHYSFLLMSCFLFGAQQDKLTSIAIDAMNNYTQKVSPLSYTIDSVVKSNGVITEKYHHKFMQGVNGEALLENIITDCERTPIRVKHYVYCKSKCMLFHLERRNNEWIIENCSPIGGDNNDDKKNYISDDIELFRQYLFTPVSIFRPRLYNIPKLYAGGRIEFDGFKLKRDSDSVYISPYRYRNDDSKQDSLRNGAVSIDKKMGWLVSGYEAELRFVDAYGKLSGSYRYIFSDVLNIPLIKTETWIQNNFLTTTNKTVVREAERTYEFILDRLGSEKFTLMEYGLAEPAWATGAGRLSVPWFILIPIVGVALVTIAIGIKFSRKKTD